VIDRRSEYLKRKNTPTPFNQGPEMQNYNRMMDLQSQAPNFTKNDPRLNELKDVRRQYNRFDKYKIGERQGVAPLDVQQQFSNQSNMFRKAAPNAYATMYPLQNLAMKYGESGGFLGMLAKEAFGKAKQAQSGIQSALKTNVGDPIRAVGSDIMNNIGIAGAADADEAEMQDYAAQTFGMGAPMDRHPGSTPVIEGPMEQSEVIYSPNAPTYYDRAEGLDFDTDPDQPYVAPDNYVEDDFGAFYTDENTLAPERPMPFDDSNREAGIMSQYPGTNFIGPRDDPNRRPTMADVAGPLYPGLIPYPEYGPGIVYQEGRGRGDLPRYGYDYAAERKGRQDSLRLRQLLDFINNQEIQQEPSRMNLR
jgi:hypothetical protein